MKLNNKKFVIGISGLAGSGKNLFSTLFKKALPEIKIIEHSFAYQLRIELAPILKDNFGLNVWTEDRVEKELIRPILIYWAEIRRKQTKGLYFIEKAAPQINFKFLYFNDIVTITDTRFATYEYDEINYIKERGVLVHISRYSEENNTKIFKEAKHEVEKFNDPKMKTGADYVIEWPDCKTDDYETELKPYIQDFIKFLVLKGYLIE